MAEKNDMGLTESQIDILLTDDGTYLFDVDARPLLELGLIELSNRPDRFKDHYQTTELGRKVLRSLRKLQ